MAKSLEKDTIRQILVRSTNWLGDAVMTTPALSAIRASFPAARIVMLATPLAAQMFACHGAVDEVIVYDNKGAHRGVLGRLRLAGELRRRGFDLAIMFPNSFDSALIPFLAGIPRRLGAMRDGRSLLLTHRYRVPAVPPAGQHQVHNDLGMLAHFGIAGGSSELNLMTTAEEDGAIARTLAEVGIGPDDFLIGVNPGATYGSAKRWYPERFAAAAAELGRRWQARVVITGSPAEAAMAGEIEKALPGALNLAGTTDVRGLMALIKRCNFFITNDSGPMHIAAAFGVPLVAVFGPTDHGATSPYTRLAAIVVRDTDCAPCKLRECPTDHRCMSAVTADDVVQAAEKLLDDTSRTPCKP